jgi:hypothetical protein
MKTLPLTQSHDVMMQIFSQPGLLLKSRAVHTKPEKFAQKTTTTPQAA